MNSANTLIAWLIIGLLNHFIVSFADREGEGLKDITISLFFCYALAPFAMAVMLLLVARETLPKNLKTPRIPAKIKDVLRKLVKILMTDIFKRGVA